MGKTLEEISVHQLLEESLAIKTVLAERFGITLETRLENPQASLLGDRRLLRAALGNLIDDAIKNNRRGRKVIICQRSDGDGVVISVSRPGKGEQERVRAGVEEVFLDKRPGGANKGIGAHPGMSLAMRIAHLHGGRIGIGLDNEHMSGLSIYLPLSS